MNSKFKAGDLVFEVSFLNGIKLIEVTNNDDPIYTIKVGGETYTENGKKFALDTGCVPSLLLATPEMRENLVAIWGEDAVPKLPLSPQEVTLKLLENQKFQLCKVSNHNNTEWQFNNVLKAIVRIGAFGEFIDSNGSSWTYGTPIDNNGNEIVKTREVSLTEMSYGLWKKV